MKTPHWKYARRSGGIAVMHEDGRLIATVHEEPYAPQIAATPELFEALEGLLNHMESWKIIETANGDIARARAALALARGNETEVARG